MSLNLPWLLCSQTLPAFADDRFRSEFTRFDGVPDGALKYNIKQYLITLKNSSIVANMVKYRTEQTKPTLQKLST